MARIGISLHRFREEAVETGREVARWCIENGHSPVIQSTDEPALVAGGTLEGIAVAESFAEVDLLVSIGGDGTMLRSVRLLEGRCIPVIGVNVGTLGFLAAVEREGVLQALEAVLRGRVEVDYRHDDRMLLAVQVWSSGSYAGSHLALNEVVIEKKEPGHTVRIAVEIDRDAFTTYAADGLIVSTPTGSTAYSLSARGPVLSPAMRAVLVTPVSPHMLFDRSLVLDRSETVRMEVLGHRSVNVAVDGDLVHSLRPGDVVEVAAAEETVRFVKFTGTRFHSILKSKFGLADR